jgi:hypothetical protein
VDGEQVVMAPRQNQRPASAAGAPVGVNYLFEDSVAILPIAVGFKPSKGSLFPLLEAFTEYHPPNASIMTQSLKPYNSKIYSELDSAMKFCNIDMRLAANTVSQLSSPGINAYSDVFKNIQAIEDAISASITSFTVAAAGKGEEEMHIVKNAQFHREDVFNYFAGTVTENSTEMRKSLMSNFERTEDVMADIFQEGTWKVSDWDGMDQFNSFWDNIIVDPKDKVAVRTKFTNNLYSQEEKRVFMILHIMQLNKEFYQAVYAKMNLGTFISSCESSIVIPVDSKYTDKTNERNKNLNIVLWNMLIERFEMLNSFVNTYFGLICNTRQSHIPLVQQFMYYAIYSCFSPIFNIYKTVVAVSGNTLTARENDMNRCKEIISGLATSFNVAYPAFFTTKLPSKIISLSTEERLANKNLILNSVSLKDWDGALLEKKIDSANFLIVIISNAFKESFVSCEHVKIPNVFVNDGRNFKVLNVYRPRESTVMDVVTAMRTSLDVGDKAKIFGKTVAYYQIFHNAAAYGYFHFKDFQLESMLKYFALTHHPLSLDSGSAMKSGGSVYTPENKATFKAAAPKAMKVSFPAKGWDSYAKLASGRRGVSGSLPALAAVSTALDHIFIKLVPKPNFKPETLTVTRPQSAPAARAATKQIPKKKASTTPKAKCNCNCFKKKPSNKKAGPRKKQPKKI